VYCTHGQVADQILALPELEEYYKDKLRKDSWKSPEELELIIYDTWSDGYDCRKDQEG
jgi:hypothetical protein